MNAQIPSLPPGAGKYENTLNWLIETAPQSARYPFVKSPRAIFYVATREEVEKRNISRFMANFGPQITADKIRELHGKVFFTVDGYDSNPSELHEIPEVREYYAQAHRHWPAWLFFADLRNACLQMVAQCVMPSVNAANPCLQEETERIKAFYLWALPTSAWCYKHAEIPREDGVSHLQQVARYLGLLG